MDGFWITTHIFYGGLVSTDDTIHFIYITIDAISQKLSCLGNVQISSSAGSDTTKTQTIPGDTPGASKTPQKIASQVLDHLGQYVPSSHLGVTIAITSLCVTLLITCCVACSRCRKRGKG